jgi:hypothetical protein
MTMIAVACQLAKLKIVRDHGSGRRNARFGLTYYPWWDVKEKRPMPDATGLSHERLASMRTAVSLLLDSGMLYLHEQVHMSELMSRLDQGVQLGRQRDQVTGDRGAAGDARTGCGDVARRKP